MSSEIPRKREEGVAHVSWCDRSRGMYAILFSTSTESPAGVLDKRDPLGDLEVMGSPELDLLERGAVIFVVQRSPRERETPALCGRIVVEGVEGRGRPGRSIEGMGGWARRVLVRVSDSRRREPFECSVVRTWDVWRHHYEGVTLLSEEQGRTLEDAWERGDSE